MFLADSAARRDLLGRYLLINCLVHHNTTLCQVQPSYAVDFSCLAPGEGFASEVFLPFILLLMFFWIVLQLAATCAFVHVGKWQA